MAAPLDEGFVDDADDVADATVGLDTRAADGEGDGDATDDEAGTEAPPTDDADTGRGWLPAALEAADRAPHPVPAARQKSTITTAVPGN